MSTPNFEEEKIQRDIRNLQDDFENFQYMVTKKIGPGSAKIPTSSIPGARQYDAVVDAGNQGDFTTVQEALDAGRSRIYVRAGTYEISETINITSDNVTIIGENKNTTILQLKANLASAFKAINIAGENFELTDIKIDGNRDNQTETNQYLIFLDDHNFTLSNCNIINGSGYGIYEDSYYGNHVISKNYFAGNIKNAFLRTDNGIIENNNFRLIYNSTLDTTNENVYLDSFSSIFSNNVVIGGKYGVYGLDLAASILNNFIYNCVTSIYVANNMYGTIINANFFSFNENGIVIEGAERNLINNNYLQHSSATANTYTAIQLKEGDRSPTYNTINSNMIAANSQSLKYGIEENSASSNYNIISGNNCKNIGTQGVLIQGANTVEANNIV